MKVIEKFNYDRKILECEFGKFSHREGAYHCDIWASDTRNMMSTALNNESATAFMDRAWSEYPEYRTFQVVDRHLVILDPYEVETEREGEEYMTDERSNAIDVLFNENFHRAKEKGVDYGPLALAVATCYTIDDLLHDDETNIVANISLDRKIQRMREILDIQNKETGDE